MSMIQEHSITLNLNLPKGDVNAKMDIFYNPVMFSNRNVSILLLNSLSNKNMKIADPLAGSGIRSLRFLKELKPDKIAELHLNDNNKNFANTIKETLKLNHIKKPTALFLHNQEASLFLNQSKGFNYIDIDPFGTPNPFLPAAVARISRHGILAITATDTAALTGTYPVATKRKYWAASMKNYLMHEIGLRILIRKVQLQGIQFDKALIPILSYHKDHYFRIYFQSEKGKERCDAIVKQHQYFLFCPNCLNYKSSIYNQEACDCKKEFQFAGPLWIGKLHSSTLLQTMTKNNPFPEEQKFLDILQEESTQDILGFYDLHEIASKLKINPPRIEPFLKQLPAVHTHFSPNGIKTEKSIKEIIKQINYLPQR